jgi:hypothetical protein
LPNCPLITSILSLFFHVCGISQAARPPWREKTNKLVEKTKKSSATWELAPKMIDGLFISALSV